MTEAHQTPRNMQGNIPLLAARPWPRLAGVAGLLLCVQGWWRNRRSAPAPSREYGRTEHLRRDSGLPRENRKGITHEYPS
jgi:hypothetical protein